MRLAPLGCVTPDADQWTQVDANPGTAPPSNETAAADVSRSGVIRSMSEGWSCEKLGDSVLLLLERQSLDHAPGIAGRPALECHLACFLRPVLEVEGLSDRHTLIGHLRPLLP